MDLFVINSIKKGTKSRINRANIIARRRPFSTVDRNTRTVEPETRYPVNKIPINTSVFRHSQPGESGERETGKEPINLFLFSFSSCLLRWIDFDFLQLQLASIYDHGLQFEGCRAVVGRRKRAIRPQTIIKQYRLVEPLMVSQGLVELQKMLSLVET